jgi:hypothetical protein
MDVIVTERGYSAHFCLSERCRFVRNTLLEYGDNKLIVSTVGRMRSLDDKKYERTNASAYYETMVFKAVYIEPYWEIDPLSELYIDGVPRELTEDICHESDFKADLIHDNMVNHIKTNMENYET